MKQNTQQTLFSLLTATLLTSSLYANENASLAPVNVTASEIVERDDLKTDSVTNLYRVESTARFGTEIITQKEIEAYAPKDFFDLLSHAIGVDYTYQGRKNPNGINIRGGGSLTYILDGAILPSTSGRLLTSLPMSAIEEIQIIRGSTALALAPSIGIGASNSGAGLNTGFIVIRTKQPKKTGGTLTAMMEKSSSQPWTNGESLYLGTPLGSSNSAYTGYIGGMVSNYNRNSIDTWYDGSESQTAMINGGMNVDGFSLNIIGYQSNGTFEMQRGVKLDGTLDASKWSYDPIKTKILSVDGNMKWSENQTTLFSFGQTEYMNKEINTVFGSNTVPTPKRYDEDTKAYSLRHNARFGNTLLQLGGQKTNSTGFGSSGPNSYNKFDTTVTGWSASVEQKLFNGAVVLDAGYRQDIKHITDSSTNVTKIKANNDVDLAPAQVIALGALWQVNNMFALNGRYFQGNEGGSGDFDIKPEPGKPAFGAEMQERMELTLEAKITPYFKPMLTYFDIDFTNQKSATTTTYTDPNDGGLYYYYTESDSHREGLELAIDGELGKDTSYRFSWTHMLENKDTTAAGVSTDNIELNSPQDRFTALISHRWDNYRANISAQQVSIWHNSNSPGGASPYVDLGDYTRVDASIVGDFKVGENTLSTKLYGRNLGDVNYATRYVTGYYYDRGRTLGLEINWAF